MINFDFSTYMKDIDLSLYQDKIKNIRYKMQNDQEMLDWFHLDKCISKEEVERIKILSNSVRANSDVFVVIGIGGSFLGAKAIIDALNPYFDKSCPEIIYAGTSLSPTYLNDLINYLKDKRVTINVISKSGTTLEPSIAFDIFYKFMKEKYSEEELLNRIIITTDKTEGNLRSLVNEKGYQSFEVPSEIGGRYSVLTTVGLFPIAVAGFDIDLLFKGARECNQEAAFNYAVVRDILYNKGRKCESFTVYEPKLEYFVEWLKQLFGETQGKEGKGILPISAINTRDLHSLGQYYQEGERILFETVIIIKKTSDLVVDAYESPLDEINSLAATDVAQAHFTNEIYSNLITIDALDEQNLGYLIYFFEIAAAAGAYLLELNPFNQPGVNAYKDLINQELK